VRRLGSIVVLGCVLALTAKAAGAEDGPPRGPVAAIELALHERLAARRAEPDSRLLPFVTDGCSGGLSRIWQGVARTFPEFAAAHGNVPPWEACCAAHDRLYHRGTGDPSPVAGYAARADADRELAECVRATAPDRSEELNLLYGLSRSEVTALYIAIAGAMHQAVRLGGMPCTGLPWRWGYGWPEC
jgi:hypothetical protein